MVSVGNLNCFHDFDIVTENNILQNGVIVSDEIVFGNRILTDYFESVSNRVLQIDDISSQFNSNPRIDEFVTVGQFSLNDNRFQKLLLWYQIKDLLHKRLYN